MQIRTALLMSLALAAGSTLAVSQTKVQLSIATGGTGGVYYPLGGGFANILSKTLPNTTVTAEVTGGAVDNLKLIGTGKADIALVQVDAAWDAINGLDKFKSGKLPISALVVMYSNNMHLVTVDGTGIAKIDDLKGKRISTGSPGSATEGFAFRILEAAGLDKDKDVKRERLGAAESVNAIKDQKIDAFFWGGGLPTAAVTDLAATPSTKIRLIDTAALVDKINAKYGPQYTASTIPKSTYTGMEADNANMSVWNFLAVNTSMPEQLAYDITKTMMETRAELAQVHKEALNIKDEHQTAKKAVIPWHPGAVRYFKEKGLKIE
jgi:uncharacterized protein